MKTRAPKVVPLKVLLTIILIWPLYSFRDPETGTPKPKGATLRVQGRTPRRVRGGKGSEAKRTL